MRITILYALCVLLGAAIAGCTPDERKDVLETVIASIPEKKVEEKVTVPAPEPVEVVIVPSSATNDLDDVDVWNDKSVRDWPVTVQLKVTQNPKKITFECDRMPWPGSKEAKPVAGNLWIIVQKDGKKYAQTWEWFQPFKCFTKDASKLSKDASDHMKGNWAGWLPKDGETYWFFISSMARDARRTVNERSNICEVIWKS
jgi:hypothetical protein